MIAWENIFFKENNPALSPKSKRCLFDININKHSFGILIQASMHTSISKLLFLWPIIYIIIFVTFIQKIRMKGIMPPYLPEYLCMCMTVFYSSCNYIYFWNIVLARAVNAIKVCDIVAANFYHKLMKYVANWLNIWTHQLDSSMYPSPW